MTLVAMFGILALLAPESSANMAERGNISGTVQTSDGKPAVGLTLKLVQDVPRTMGRPGRSGKSTGFDSGAVGLQGRGEPRTKIVAQATTDANGKFQFNNIEAGNYRIEAGNRNMGWIYQDVSVEANKTADLGEIKLVKV